MKKPFLLLAPLLACHCPARAQTGPVTGLVLAAPGQPAPYANVLLRRAQDSTLVQAQLTTAAGRYAFADVPPGAYRVAVLTPGFNYASSAPLTVGPSQPRPPG